MGNICFLAKPRGMWDLSSLSRDQTCASALEVWSLKHWTTREVPPWPTLSQSHSIKVLSDEYPPLSVPGAVHSPSRAALGPVLSPAGHRHLGFEQSHSQLRLSQPLPCPSTLQSLRRIWWLEQHQSLEVTSFGSLNFLICKMGSDSDVSQGLPGSCWAEFVNELSFGWCNSSLR